MTKTEAAIKIKKLLALANNNSNEQEAACATKIAQTMLLKYEIDTSKMYSLRMTQPARLRSKLVALRNHVIRVKMWCFLCQHGYNDLAVELGQIQEQLEIALAKYGAPRLFKKDKRSVASTKGDRVKMQRKYL